MPINILPNFKKNKYHLFELHITVIYLLYINGVTLNIAVHRVVGGVINDLTIQNGHHCFSCCSDNKASYSPLGFKLFTRSVNFRSVVDLCD